MCHHNFGRLHTRFSLTAAFSLRHSGRITVLVKPSPSFSFANNIYISIFIRLNIMRMRYQPV